MYEPRTPSSKLDLELDFILDHFAGNWFPRTISTRTTEGRQRWVNDRDEALARLKQANYLDCRINAHSRNDIKGPPNFLFLDIDSTDWTIIKNIIDDRFTRIGANPTILFTGSGYHIYQPISYSISLDEIEDFSSYREVSKRFLRFAAQYLSDGKCDPNHNPSFKSCMVRVPGSINSKNGNEVKIIQRWDRHRPNIALLLGSFYSWLATKKLSQYRSQNYKKNYYNRINNSNGSSKIQWIELLLKMPLDDYRKTIINLVLAPYLINIRRLEYNDAVAIIKSWLDSCGRSRKLDFDSEYLISAALTNATNKGYKPMRSSLLKYKNPSIYEKLRI